VTESAVLLFPTFVASSLCFSPRLPWTESCCGRWIRAAGRSAHFAGLYVCACDIQPSSKRF